MELFYELLRTGKQIIFSFLDQAEGQVAMRFVILTNKIIALRGLWYFFKYLL